jgi:hypothetical protein
MQVNEVPLPFGVDSGAVGQYTAQSGGAWKHDPAAKYDPATIAKLRQMMVEEIRKMMERQEKLDCADVALAALIRAAAKLGLRVRLRYWSERKWNYYDSASAEYSSVEEFERAVRQGMGASNLWDNTRQIDLDKVQVGDIILYDLRDQRDPRYSGHTMPVLVTQRGADGKLTGVTVAEGHIGQMPGAGTPVNEHTYTPAEIREKGGWGGPGRKERQPDGTWRIVEPGAREWDWDRIGGVR